MNTLERVLVEKAGQENGWEYIVETNGRLVRLASARHASQATIRKAETESPWEITVSGDLVNKELKRSFPEINEIPGGFFVQNKDQLCRILRRAAELAQSLPNQALKTYISKLDEVSAATIEATEAERLVRQRIGQSTFRDALMDYWEGACAVTGLALPEVLRASHAKPWADCGTEAERLDVFNGFLLCANLDALFDRGLITFDKKGYIVCSSYLSSEQKKLLQIHNDHRLRWISKEHQPYVDWHVSNVFRK
jgi:predicted restriction endonuclease